MFDFGSYNVRPLVIIYPGLLKKYYSQFDSRMRMDTVETLAEYHVGPVYVIDNQASEELTYEELAPIEDHLVRAKINGFPAIRIWSDNGVPPYASWKARGDEILAINPEFPTLREAVRTIKCHGRYRDLWTIDFSNKGAW